MKLLSIEYIPGVEFEALGIVKGTVVQTKNVGRDFMAGMKTLVGGEIVGYTEMLNEARQIATKRMVDEAKEMDADAVIGVKYGSSQVMAKRVSFCLCFQRIHYFSFDIFSIITVFGTYSTTTTEPLSY